MNPGGIRTVTCVMKVLARVGESQWPCVSSAKSCTRNVSETLGFAYWEMCAHSCLKVFLALYL